MPAKKRGLGKNLDALLSSVEQTVAVIDNLPRENELSDLPINLIKQSQYQPRQIFNSEKLAELAESIRTQGVIQPIIVRKIDDSYFEIIAGERRWRAAQLAGLDKIPALVRGLDDFAVIAMALIENIQREDLNPIEEALALHRLSNEFDLTHQQLANAVGKSRTTVTNILRLMTLNNNVKEKLKNGDIEMGHARALLSLELSEQLRVADIIIKKQLTVREAEKFIQQNKHKQIDQPVKNAYFDKIADWEEKLSMSVLSKVDVKINKDGKGRVVIHFMSPKDVEMLIKKLEQENC